MRSRAGSVRGRSLWAWSFRGLLASFLTLACGCPAELRQPEEQAASASVNVLLISIDSLRADHVSAYGYPRKTTPNLDRLADEGVLFERMIAESSWTLPSHLTVLTGLSSWAHGAIADNRRLDERVDTLAELLRARGYRSEGFASGPYLHPIFGFGDGFDRYELLGRSLYDEEGMTLERVTASETLLYQLELRDRDARRARTSGQLAARVEEAVARMAGEPFFIFVHMFDVHYDYDPPEAYWRRFNPDYDGALDPSDFLTNSAIHKDMARKDFEQVMALYDGEILWTDEHVGRMLETLTRYGVEENTLVAIIGDHGDEFFEHGGKGHRKTLYDEQLFVPFILRLPDRLPASRRLAMQTRMVDVMPTILALTGTPQPAGLVGESLTPYILEERPERDLDALSLLLRDNLLVRTLRRSEGKLQITLPFDMIDREYQGRVEYFDLRSDPGENQPLYAGSQLEAAETRLEEIFAREENLRRRFSRGGGVTISIPAPMRRALEKLGYVEE